MGAGGPSLHSWACCVMAHVHRTDEVSRVTLSRMETEAPAGVAVGAQQWHRMIGAVFGPLDLHLGDESRFSGRIRHVELAGLGLTDVSCAYEDAQRRRRHMSGDQRESFVLAMPLSGRLQIAQSGQACEVRPGHFALFALNEPHRYFHDDEVRVLSLRAPCDMLRARVRKVDDLVATAFAADRGAARITFDFLASIMRESDHLPEHVAGSYSGRIADLAAVMLDCSRQDLPIGQSSVRHALHRRCLQIIEAQLGDPELSPERIAAACGISTRYLHKVFQDSDQTLGETLRNRRLEVCRERLLAQRGDVQVKDVALSAGFRSVSHFCNAFKARFGVAPRDVRRDPPLQ